MPVATLLKVLVIEFVRIANQILKGQASLLFWPPSPEPLSVFTTFNRRFHTHSVVHSS